MHVVGDVPGVTLWGKHFFLAFQLHSNYSSASNHAVAVVFT